MQNHFQWLPSFLLPFRALLSRWLLSLLIVFGAAFIFLELAEDVWLKEGFSWDVPLMRDIHRLSTPWLDALMRGVWKMFWGLAWRNLSAGTAKV